MSQPKTTSVTGTILDATGSPITDPAHISFLPVTNAGVPLSPSFEGDLISNGAVTVKVTNGQFAVTLLDTQGDGISPQNFGYRVTGIDDLSGKQLLDPRGYSCFQPTGTSAVLAANYAAQVTVQTGPVGESNYDLWIAAGNTGTVADFLLSLGAGVTLAQLTSILTGQTVTSTSTPGTAAVSTTFGSLVAGSSVPNAGGADTWVLGVPFTVSEPITDIVVGLIGTTAGAKLKFALTTVDTGANTFANGTEWEYTIPATTAGYTEIHLTAANGDYSAVTPQVGQSLLVYSSAGKLALGESVNGDYFYYKGGENTTAGETYPGLNKIGFHPNIQVIVTKPATAGTTATSVALDPKGYRGLSNNTGLTATSTTTSTSSASTPGNPIYVEDALTAGQATSLLQVRTMVAARTAIPTRFAMTYPYYSLVARGHSIVAGAGITGGYANSVPAVANGFLGTGNGVNGVSQSGDEAADCAVKVFNHDNFGIADKVMSYVDIGWNDAHKSNAGLTTGVGAHETVFVPIFQAILAWLGTQKEYRTDAGTVTAANWTKYTALSAVVGLTTSTAGAQVLLPITSYGDPVYVWYVVQDGVAGVATANIDGGTPVQFNASATGPIATQNGGTMGVQLLRLPAAAGAHNVYLTCVSGTLTVLSVGTTSPHSYCSKPVAAALLHMQNLSAISAADAVVATGQATRYSQLILDSIKLLQGDGGDYRAIDNRTPMKDGTDATIYADFIHPNNAGALAYGAAVAYALQLAPADTVRRAIPPAGSKGVPGDAWYSSGNFYGVAADQSIHVVTATGTV